MKTMDCLKLIISLLLVFSLGVAVLSLTSFKQRNNPEPWTEKQLLAPEDLARSLNGPTARRPVVICVGPGALIKGSLDMGPAHEKGNYEKLKLQLEKYSRDADIVIYCGCCPFAHCPNIRPAFSLMNEMGFTHQRLLNISTNIKTDWISKGYPVNK